MDANEKEAVTRILQELPEDHPARKAFQNGTDTIRLTHIVGRQDLIEKLTNAWLESYNRMLRRSGSFRP